jgi:putative ABC transport system permease protein
MYDGLNQAVAGQGFLDLTHLTIGDLTWVPVDGVLVTVRITGRILDADDNGDVLAFGLDTLSSAGGPQPPSSYDVVLRPGTSAAAARAELLRWSRGQLVASIVANPADGLGIVRLVIAISIPVLAIIGLASLLTATAIGLRDHQHETGVLAALGLTPRQVMATLVVNTMLLTTVGWSIGTAAGLVAAPRLINAQGRSSGMGSGIAATPSLVTLALTLAVALLVTTVAGAAMARRTIHQVDPTGTPTRPRLAPIPR